MAVYLQTATDPLTEALSNTFKAYPPTRATLWLIAKDDPVDLIAVALLYIKATEYPSDDTVAAIIRLNANRVSVSLFAAAINYNLPNTISICAAHPFTETERAHIYLSLHIKPPKDIAHLFQLPAQASIMRPQAALLGDASPEPLRTQIVAAFVHDNLHLLTSLTSHPDFLPTYTPIKHNLRPAPACDAYMASAQ